MSAATNISLATGPMQTEAWVEDFIAAARKNLPAATLRPIVWWVDMDLAKRLLAAAGAQFYAAEHMGNRSLTITGIRRDGETQPRSDEATQRRSDEGKKRRNGEATKTESLNPSIPQSLTSETRA